MYRRSRLTYRRYFWSALLVLACLFPLAATSAHAAANVLTFTSVTHNFGSAAIGTSVNYGIKVTNSSTTTAYLNFQVNLTGSSTFTSETNCPASIAPGASCELIFVFTPTALGTVTATWDLTGTGDSTFSYNPQLPGTLTGTAAEPGLNLSTGGHNFGTEFANEITQPYGIVLTNSTVDTIDLLIANGNTNFKVASAQTSCGTTLAPNKSCNIAWYFAPTKGFSGSANQPKSYSFLNTITATDATTGQPVILLAPGYAGSPTPVQVTGVTLTGYGISGPSNYVGISTSTHNFGEWVKGDTSTLYGIQLINTEPGPVQITYTEGSGFTNFAAPSNLDNCFTSGTTATLQSGAACQAQFYFLPNNQTYGPLTATLGLTATYGGAPINIEDLSNSNANVSGVTLSGTQVGGFLNLQFASHDFGGWPNATQSTVFDDQLNNTGCSTISPTCATVGNPFVITLKAGSGGNFPKAGTCTNGQTLYPTGSTAGSSSCTLNFHFDSTSGVYGPLTELYAISAVDSVTGLPVQLTAGGTVVQGVSLAGYSAQYDQLFLTSVANNFGEQGVGNTSGTYTTYLYNVSGSTVDVSYAYSNPSMGSNFTLVPATPVCTGGSSATVLKNNGYCTFNWTFNPNEVGPISVVYNMTATSGGTPVTVYNVNTDQPVSGVTLSGTGVN